LKGWTLALDPSLHNTGWALFCGQVLEDYGVVSINKRKFTGYKAIEQMYIDVGFVVGGLRFNTIVSEVQICRGRIADRMKPQDMMNLHAVCVLCLYGINSYHLIKRVPMNPTKIPKDIVHERILDKYGIKYGIKKSPGPQDYLDAIDIGRRFFEGE